MQAMRDGEELPNESGRQIRAAAPDLVPHEVIPCDHLPPLAYRELPAAPPWRTLVGPSILLAGLALGSGEFVIWPNIVFKSGFVFFWACLLGVTTQYFLNMEIARWTLATGETAVTGFCRLNRHWAWILLICNVVPWMWPGWSTGAATLTSWLIWGPQETAVETVIPLSELEAEQMAPLGSGYTIRKGMGTASWELVWTGPLASAERRTLEQAVPGLGERAFRAVAATGGVSRTAKHAGWLAAGSLLLIGLLLTAGPVVYNTVERVQFLLVGAIFAAACVLGLLLIRVDAWTALGRGLAHLGELPPASAGLGMMTLLGAVAFAGAGGTLNLGQSHFIREKGYGMGSYIGRITSPITGQPEPVADTGFLMRLDAQGLARWKQWWKAANLEHLLSFFMTCVVCLVLLSLLSYSLFYNPDGTRRDVPSGSTRDFSFIWDEGELIARQLSGESVAEASAAAPPQRTLFGEAARTTFLLLGIALLLTTELGVLDAGARISTDILKTNYLRDHPTWTQGRIYFALLWTEILLGCAILLAGFNEPLVMLTLSAAMNGGVMFLYSFLLLYLNTKILPRPISIGPLRFAALVWAAAFFGFLSLQMVRLQWIAGR